jgi:hypothetical protein
MLNSIWLYNFGGIKDLLEIALEVLSSQSNVELIILPVKKN